MPKSNNQELAFRQKPIKILFSTIIVVIISVAFLSSFGSLKQEKKMKQTKRSVVIGKRGIVATSQPLAVLAG